MMMRIAIAGLIIVFASTARAQTRPADRPLAQDIVGIVTRLQHSDAAVRKAAADELTRRAKARLTPEDGSAILRQAESLPASTASDRRDAQSFLVRAAAQHPDEVFVPLVRQIFPKLSPGARYEALELLERIKSASAARTFVTLVREHAAKIPEIPVYTLGHDPQFGEIYFPALLEIAAKHPPLGESVYLLALDFADTNKVEPAALEKEKDSIVAAYRRRHERLAELQGKAGVKWMFTRAYQADREPAGVLLDLLAHLPPEVAEPPLRDAMKLNDPRLKLFAALSLIRLSKDVPYRDLDTIAASPETRATLFQQLQRQKRLDLFPEKYRKQEALAESRFVEWLAYPTELGRVPDQVELMKILPAADISRGDYYVFRFRTDDPKASEWTAGVAGPFKRGEPNVDDDGDTFSRFDKWDSASAEQHLARIVDSLEKSRKEQANP